MTNRRGVNNPNETMRSMSKKRDISGGGGGGGRGRGNLIREEGVVGVSVPAKKSSSINSLNSATNRVVTTVLTPMKPPLPPYSPSQKHKVIMSPSVSASSLQPITVATTTAATNTTSAAITNSSSPSPTPSPPLPQYLAENSEELNKLSYIIYF